MLASSGPTRNEMIVPAFPNTACWVVLEFVLPESFYHLVPDPAHDLFAIVFVGVQAEDIGERGVVSLKEGVEGIA